MIELIEQPNGNLLIKVIDTEDYKELYDNSILCERGNLWEMLEQGGYVGNDWYSPCNLGLTEVPAIAKGAISYASEDDWEPNDYEKLWIYPDYMLSSFMDKLLEDGEVIFNLLID